MANKAVIYGVDAGSVPKNKFAWVCSKDRSRWSFCIKELANAIIADLQRGAKVALGFECPLFVPVPGGPGDLGKARRGECTSETGSKPFTAAAGACVTMTGLPSLAWVLRHVHAAIPEARATTRWKDLGSGDANVFVWEAFVSGSEKAVPPSDHADALLAVQAFEKSLHNMAGATRVTCEDPFSLAGAAILWAGMSSDVGLLHHAAVVLRPLLNGV